LPVENEKKLMLKIMLKMPNKRQMVLTGKMKPVRAQNFEELEVRPNLADSEIVEWWGKYCLSTKRSKKKII
jgi:hypothetical protein